MVKVNNVDVVDRHNRPSILSKVGLRTFFMNGGEFVDPYQISSVSVFTLTQNSTPSSVLTSGGEVSATPKMQFSVSDGTETSAFSTANYIPSDTNGNGTGNSCSSVSGIYRLGTGEYIAVLDGTLNLSGVFNSSALENTASAVGTYIDVWTVKLTAGSDFQVFINTFDLFNDTFYTITQPLLLNTKNRLFNNRAQLGSKIDLKVGTDITLANKDVAEEIKNIFKDAAITNAGFKIVKHNPGEDLADYTVSGFADTSGTVDVTSDNTLVFNWDLGTLGAVASNSAGLMGSITGTYFIQVQYSLLDQTFVSPKFALNVTT